MNVASLSTPPPLTQAVLCDRYAAPGERTVDEVRARIARALAEAEPAAGRQAWAARFLWAQRHGFIAGGRIAAHAGSRTGTMINCFVQPLGSALTAGAPRSADPMRDGASLPCVYEALSQAAQTLHLGGGVGIDYSSLAPRGTGPQDAQGAAPGPVATLRLFEGLSTFLAGFGRRGAAQMAVLRCDHPDIAAFMAAKAASGLQHVSLAVAVTDAFMVALQAGRSIDLVHDSAPSPYVASCAGSPRRSPAGGWVHDQMPAAAVWRTLVQQAHARGDPGVLFIDRINADNNLGYCEHIAATNPCGEQPLPAYGGCCLGSIDLPQLVRRPFESGAWVDIRRLRQLVPVAVRMLDNVLDLTAWPLPEQKAQALSTRRIGLGFTGLSDMLAMLGLHYADPLARAVAANVARHLRDTAYEASIDLARERGAFARLDAEGLLRPNTAASRLPAALRDRIRREGLRNSHLLCVAPAGSISLAFADNTSSGIEPPLAWGASLSRRRAPAGVRPEDPVADRAWRLHQTLHGPHTAFPPTLTTALGVSPQAHLEMVGAVAPYIDGSIAKTINLATDCSTEHIDALLRRAWRLGLKGLTVFRPPEATV